MTPRFGDRVVNRSASDGNPRKRGLFVRMIVLGGNVNPGSWWSVTDGKGDFWLVQPDACEIEKDAE